MKKLFLTLAIVGAMAWGTAKANYYWCIPVSFSCGFTMDVCGYSTWHIVDKAWFYDEWYCGWPEDDLH